MNTTHALARIVPLCWAFMLFTGCLGDGVIDKTPCVADLASSGAAEVSWSSSTALECEGYGPSLDNSIDLYFRRDFDALRVRTDFVTVGATGTFDDYFVSFTHEDDEWGSFADLPCTLTFDRNEDVGKGEFGQRVWAVEGSVACEGPLTPFQSEGTVDIGEVAFQGWYQQPR